VPNHQAHDCNQEEVNLMQWLHLSGRTRGLAVLGLLSAVAAALLTTAAAGKGSGPARTGGYPTTPKIAFISGATAADPFWASVQKGAEAAAADQGVDLNYVVPGGASVDATVIVRALNAAIGQKPDGIVVADAFPSALDPIIKKQTKAGVPVLIANGGVSSVGPTGGLGFVGQTDYDAGLAAGTAMAKAGAKYALCLNVPGLPIAQQRCDGFKKTFAAAGRKVTYIDIPLSQITNATAVERAIEGSVRSHKGVDSVMALGIIEWNPLVAALKQMRLSGKVRIATFDLSTAALKSIQSGGTLFAIDQQPYLIGYYGVTVVAQYLRYGLLPPHGGIATGPRLITKANAAATLEYNKQGVRGAA
jgi:simple sugar transport system substrate-binding protein